MTDVVRKAQEAIARTEALGDRRATIFTAFEPQRILDDAKRLEALSEEARGAMPLFGLTVSVKDLFDEKGQTTSAGSRLLNDRKPAESDAKAVARVKAAGALLFGRTTLSEFAYSGVGLNPHYGTHGNVFDQTRIPGGSTSGGALTVAFGLCDAALGTDTGGSVRIPAAINGLYGYKPTQSAVPRDGVHPLADTYDSAGPLTRDFDTALALFAVLSGGAKAAAAPDRPLRLAVPQNAFVNGMDEATSASFSHAKEALRKAGHSLIDVDFGFLHAAVGLNRIIVAVEAHAIYRDDLEKLETVGDPRVLSRIRYAETLSRDKIDQAYADRADTVERFAETLDGFDALIAPTISTKAPTIAEAEENFDRVNATMLRNCSLINLADGCAMTMPVASGDAMPGALMAAAPSGFDSKLLAVCGIIRKAVPAAN